MLTNQKPAQTEGTGPAACTLELKIVPNAPRNEVTGWLGQVLKIKIHAPALDGRANDELQEFLAAEFDLPRRAITLIRGDRSRHKLIRIEGVTLAEARQRLDSRGENQR